MPRGQHRKRLKIVVDILSEFRYILRELRREEMKRLIGSTLMDKPHYFQEKVYRFLKYCNDICCCGQPVHKRLGWTAQRFNKLPYLDMSMSDWAEVRDYINHTLASTPYEPTRQMARSLAEETIGFKDGEFTWRTFLV